MKPTDTTPLLRLLRRREALLTLGAGALWAGCGGRGATRAAAGTDANAAAVCVLQPEVTEGPYYIADTLTRRNIRSGKHGVALALHVTVVDDDCKPIKGADVEIWHADAQGVYSGFSGNGGPGGGGPDNAKRFLRGHQKSDADGHVRFDTVYPGWYRGRTPHIHLKVHVGGNVEHTGQLFFNDATSDAVYRTASYRSRGAPDTTNGADSIYAQSGGGRSKVKLARRAKGKGYTGRITVGVQT